MPRNAVTKGRPKKARRPRGDPESGAKEIERTKRALDILDLRRQGFSLEAIGQAMSPPITRERVRVIIVEYLARCVADQVEDMRKVELARLDELQSAFYTSAVNGDHAACVRVLDIMDRRARLMGLYAPVKAEVGGPDGGPLQIIIAAEDRRL